MIAGMPEYLFVKPEELGKSSGVSVRVVPGSMEDIGRDLANVMMGEITAAKQRGRPATFIVPVGPVDQFPILAEIENDSFDRSSLWRLFDEVEQKESPALRDARGLPQVPIEVTQLRSIPRLA